MKKEWRKPTIGILDIEKTMKNWPDNPKDPEDPEDPGTGMDS